MDKQQQIDELLRKYLNNTDTPAEREAFWQLAAEDPSTLDPALEALWQQAREAGPQRTDAQWESVRNEAYARAAQWEQRGKVIRIRRFVAAAAITALLATSAYFWINRSTRPAIQVAADVAPGKQGAVLTLGNGQKIILDSLQNGIIAMQNGVPVKLEDGQLAYSRDAQPSSMLSYNTMTTPKGRQFRISLPDGTIVWMNAASSVRYPTTFNGTTRNVEVSGEVYFEVAQNEKMPFMVSVNNNMRIEVLGTSFNVNAYTDEPSVKTTLIGGAVRIIAEGQQKILKPGQQAQLSGRRLQVATEVDTEDVMAWKNGIFNFQDKSLQEIMRQIERWYDIEVVYEGPVPAINFYGEMGRDVSLSKVLFFLKGAGVKYRMEGERKLVIESTKQ